MTFLTLLCLVLLVLPETHCDNITLADPLAAQLQFLLNEEKGLRRNLEIRVQRLRNEVLAINNVLGSIHLIIEPRHKINNNVACATSIASDQPAHTRSLIRAFASHFNIL